VSAVLALLAVAALSLVAAAGVAAGYRRRDPVPIEPLEDPLEDRRRALLRSLADLDEARDAGGLEDQDYRRLREDTEGRVARLLRAIDERAARAATADPGPGARAPRRPARPGSVPPWAVATLLAATVGSVLVVGLLREAEPLAAPTTPQGEDPLAFFERRVRDHPDDLAARLDLAHRYLEASRVADALAEYRVALGIDPRSAEALANVGLILHLADRPADGLRSVDAALEVAPEYPEALFIRGVILLCGLERAAPAAGAFERYLDAAPFGSERDAVEEVLRGIDAGAAGSDLCST
jgi:cytochrome c-type biogenesis protein CcmH/NrfG